MSNDASTVSAIFDDYYDDFSLASSSSDAGEQEGKDGKDARTRLHKFCKAVPKIELHAHLNGTIRESTLIELAKERGVKLSSKLHNEHAAPSTSSHVGETKPNRDRHRHMYNTKPRSLLECFEIFAEIPKVINDLKALERITQEALQDNAAENVAYLELRTGPKQLLYDSVDKSVEGVCTKRQYVETIITAMRKFEDEELENYRQQKTSKDDSFFRLPLIPRLIVSVDRSGTVEQAEENISLAIDLFREGNPFIVGVELGGNPTKNDFRDFQAVFERARKAGLPVAIHCGEVPCAKNDEPDENSALTKAYEEAMAILKFKPERLGHALLLPDAAMKQLLSDPIPIEACPTSNTMTLELNSHHGGSLVDGLRMHPRLKKWLETDYPISLNTDDSGLFCTNATRELLLTAKAFHVGEEVLSRIIANSLSHIFESSKTVQSKLSDRIQKRMKDVIESLA